MKIILISILSISLSLQNNCLAQEDITYEGELFFCRSHADMRNIVPLPEYTVIRPEKSNFLILTNKSGLVKDTLNSQSNWGPVMGITVSGCLTLSISYLNHGLLVDIHEDSFRIREEIPFNCMSEIHEMGMKTLIKDYLVGIVPNKNVPAKHSIYQYELINTKDSQHFVLNEPLRLKSRYYQQMIHLANYQIFKDEYLIITHAEGNSLLVFNLKSKTAKAIALPSILHKNKETWYVLADNEKQALYLIHNHKKEPNEIYSYDFDKNEMQFMFKTSERILSIFNGKAFYRKVDDEKDVCFYFIDLEKDSSSESKTISLDEITISNN